MVILREQKKHTKAVELLENDTWSVAEGKQAALLGIAVDIGTTTIAMTVISLCEKRLLGQLSETNEQTKLGADVMLRIMNALSGKQERLHQMVVCQIEQMAKRLLFDILDENKIDGSKVCFSIVGNTTMCHLFLNKSVEGLAGYPFQSAYSGNWHCLGEEVGMKYFKKAKIHVLSGIAAHVGSDALSVIGAERLFEEDKVQLAVDLGTNAEIILNDKGKIRVCSAAAGPAFEGKGIQCGMPAKPGAINGIKISKTNGNILLEYVAGEEPKGICGSGLVDAVAELRKCGVLQEDGYLLSGEEAKSRGLHSDICMQLEEKQGQNAFIFYRGKEGGRGQVALLQEDIRNVQLAKGAIQAGILALLQESRISLDELDELIVAGVLGSCVRPVNAVKIGLLPRIDARKLHFVGNAAGKGAVCILTEAAFLSDMEALAKDIQHMELAEREGFQKLLLQGMKLESWS